MTIDNSAGDDEGGHNTDGFDIGESNNVVITGAKVYNQDDCVAVNSGTEITFSGGTCSGGHGLSIGSVGGRDDNTVDTVTFKDSEVTNSDNGTTSTSLLRSSNRAVMLTNYSRYPYQSQVRRNW
jgi:polygalacturonase